MFAALNLFEMLFISLLPSGPDAKQSFFFPEKSINLVIPIRLSGSIHDCYN